MAHSMGGLVARSYMNHHSHNTGRWLNQRGGERVRVLITLGTPHHGTPAACDKSRDELAPLRWQILLDFFSLVYWQRPGRGVGVDWNEPNRKDLLWDNYDRRLNANNRDLNAFLAALNTREERYAAKMIVYYGYIGENDPERAYLASVYGIGESSPGEILNLAARAVLIKDDNMKQRVASLAMDYGMRRYYRLNDGLVPAESGAALDVPVARRISCAGYDHDDLKDGSCVRCANGLRMLESVAADLGIRTPTQAGRISAEGIVNAASLIGGALSAGEIVTIFGSGIGVADGQIGTVNLGGLGVYPRALAGTRVLFDGQPAPVIYASAGQVNTIVPYAVAGKQSVQVHVDYQAVCSNTVTMRVAGSAPGMFTVGATGRGAGAVLNQNYSLNTATDPAQPGSVVMLFGTGEGQTNPAGLDGEAHNVSLPRVARPVVVRIGGIPAQVLYAGVAPGYPGLFQINAVIPRGAAAGVAPVVVTVGGIDSQQLVVAGEPPRLGLSVTSYWDMSQRYRDGERQVVQLDLLQQGGLLSGSARDIFASYFLAQKCHSKFRLLSSRRGRKL